MKKFSVFIFAVMLSASSGFASASNGAMGNGGGAPAMDIYRCVVSDSSGHMQSKYVPRYYCEQVGGKVIF